MGKKRERSYSDGPIIDQDIEQQEEEVVINISINYIGVLSNCLGSPIKGWSTSKIYKEGFGRKIKKYIFDTNFIFSALIIINSVSKRKMKG